MQNTTRIGKHRRWLTYTFIICALLSLSACASRSSRLNRLHVGMNKAEVRKIMGKPHSVSAEGDIEFFCYNLLNKRMGEMREYAVKLTRDRVETFGARTDFAPVLFPISTNAPSITSNHN